MVVALKITDIHLGYTVLKYLYIQLLLK